MASRVLETMQASPTTALALALALLVVWKVFFRTSVLPALPIVGYDEGQWFAWPRTLYRAFVDYRPLYWEAHEKYLSKGKPCIMPEPNDTHVVLPASLSQWLVSQPDDIVSSKVRQNDFLQTRYTFPIPKMAEHPHHLQVIKRDLTRKVSALTSEIWEELEEGFGLYWGKDTREWKEVNLMETMIRIVTRTSNRLFVGKEACRNERYLDLCTSFAQDVPVSGVFIRMVPQFLQPLLAPIITLPNRYHTYKIRATLRPEIERRLRIPEGDKDAPNDFLQWFINYARHNLEAEESTPKFIADRMATINFAAIHTSTFSIVNAIVDVVTAPEKDGILAMMKAEMEDILAADNGQWTKTSVQRMVKTDSTLRESMRHSSFMTGAIARVVVAKEGIRTPDGVHIKQGNMVEIPAWPTHIDPGTYKDPYTFVPLRFLDHPESNTATTGGGGGTAEETRKTRGLTCVDTTHEFLTFGHGRHACPGRFFAANELKLLLAYISLHYDIEPAMTEPKAIAFGSVMAPNPKLSVRIRRKADV